jgi:DNA polymerase-1
VKTFSGRRYPLNFLEGGGQGRLHRQAVNAVVQGTAADLFKFASVRMHQQVQQHGWEKDCQQVLWLHDEIVLRVRRSMLWTILPELVETMEEGLTGWSVPLKVDVAAGRSWGELVDLRAQSRGIERIGVTEEVIVRLVNAAA